MIADVVAFERESVVDASAAGGHRDPRWDADATAFLAAQLRGLHADAENESERLPDAMPQAERLALAGRILAAGCDDAMVLYQIGRLFEAAGNHFGAHRVFERGRAGGGVAVRAGLQARDVPGDVRGDGGGRQGPAGGE